MCTIVLHEVAESTQWVQTPNTNAFYPAGISRQDLRDYQQAMRNMITSVDDVLTKLNDLDAANVPMPSVVREIWKTKRQFYTAALEQASLLEANWSEWSPNGFTETDPALKPWQRQVLQLQEELVRSLAVEKSSKSTASGGRGSSLVRPAQARIHAAYFIRACVCSPAISSWCLVPLFGVA